MLSLPFSRYEMTSSAHCWSFVRSSQMFPSTSECTRAHPESTCLIQNSNTKLQSTTKLEDQNSKPAFETCLPVLLSLLINIDDFLPYSKASTLC